MKSTKKMKIISALFIVVVMCAGNHSIAQNHVGEQQVGIQTDGSILVPTNQLLQPAGFQVYMPGRPVDLVSVTGQNLIAVKNKNSLDLIRVSDRTILQSLLIPRSGSSVTGISYSEKNRCIYLTDAGNKIHIAKLDESNIMKWETPILLPQPVIGGNPFPGGIIFDESKNKILVTLSRNNSLAVIDMKDTSIVEIPVGVAPYDVLLKSANKAYVTNWGGRIPKEGESSYNSSGSQVLVDPETGIANNGTVSVVDLENYTVKKSIKVGLHPSGMVFNLSKTLLFVACANSDIISVIDTETDKIIDEISVRMDHDLPFGSSPNALAISPDGETIYVANGTDNALCVIESVKPFRVKGYIPTGWYPGSVALNNSGTYLYVANVKGIGSRNQRTDRKGYNSHDHMGSVSIIPVPSENKLKEMTEVAIRNNSLSQAGEYLNTKNKRVAVPFLPGQTGDCEW